MKNETIKVNASELQFIFENEPRAFARTISEALAAEGYDVNRVKVFQELRTIKGEYNKRIIDKSRELLKTIQKVEYPNT